VEGRDGTGADCCAGRVGLIEEAAGAKVGMTALRLADAMEDALLGVVIGESVGLREVGVAPPEVGG
jgi:hypothetical protein